MKIEIWSDIACPFCFMGKKQLFKALERLPYGKDVEIIWKSFQLNPELSYIEGKSINEYLSEMKGMSKQEVETMQSRLTEQGVNWGIRFQFDQTKVNNTLKAHVLIHIAQKQGKGSAVKENLFSAYFENGANIEDEKTLREIAQKNELELSKYGENPFENSQLIEEVQLDQYQAQQVGARGVPYFVFNEGFSLSGAHGEDVIYKVIETVRMKSNR